MEMVTKDQATGSKSSKPVFTFKNIQFTRRKEVVKPYLHWLDERALKKGVDEHFNDLYSLKQQVIKICKAKKIPQGDIEAIVAEMYETYKQGKIPQSFIHDLFNFYYNSVENLDFEPLRVSNQIAFKMLERMNQPALKILSKSNPVKTMVLARTLIMNFLFGYAWKKQQDKQSADSLMNQMNQCNNKGAVVSFPNQPNSGQGQGESNSTAPDAGNDNGKDSSGADQDSNPSPEGQQCQDDNSSIADNDGEPQSEEQSDNSSGHEGPIQDDDNNDEVEPESTEEQEPGYEDEYPDEDSWDDEGDWDEPEENGSDNVKEDNASDVEQSASSSDGGKGAGKGTGGFKEQEQILDELMNRVLNTPEAMNFSAKALDQVRAMFSDMDESMEEGELNEAWQELGELNNFNTSLLSKLNPETMDQIAEEVSCIRMNMSGVKNSIKHLLDKTINYFSSREESYFESLFDSDTLDGLDDIEMLHPKLRKLSLDDIMVKENRKIGKLDMYVDISGSMGSPSGMSDDDGKAVSCEQFAKATVVKLKEMDLLDELYTFDNVVHKHGNTMLDILSMGGSGGTDISNVVKKVKQTGKNSLVITDGCDHCSEYNDQVFFLAVAGANFSSFSPAVRKKFVENNQLCIFDGHQTYKVGLDGYAIQ